MLNWIGIFEPVKARGKMYTFLDSCRKEKGAFWCCHQFFQAHRVLTLLIFLVLSPHSRNSQPHNPPSSIFLNTQGWVQLSFFNPERHRHVIFQPTVLMLLKTVMKKAFPISWCTNSVSNFSKRSIKNEAWTYFWSGQQSR